MSFNQRALQMLPSGLQVDVRTPEGNFSAEIRPDGSDLDVDIPQSIKESRALIAELISGALSQIITKFERKANQANVANDQMYLAYQHSFERFLNEEGERIHAKNDQVRIKFHY